MSTEYSIDLFLEKICIVVFFPSDGEVLVIHDFNSHGRRHDGGDIIHYERIHIENTQNEELAVVLGWGESTEEATAASKVYIERLMRWHGQDGPLCFMGVDVSNSQAFL